MASSEKPKVRLVVYVPENVYNEINAIAQVEDRSISSVTERKIMVGLGLDKGGRAVAQDSTARIGPAHSTNSDISKKDPFANISEENLTLLAKKLQHVIESQDPTPIKAVPDPTFISTLQQVSPQINPTQIDSLDRKEIFQTQNLAKLLKEFVIINGLTHHEFRNKYGFDISQITRWITGTRGMSFEVIQKTKEILKESNML